MGLTEPPYLSGFGSEHASEAVAGALPVGRNSPQHVPFGLYAEQLSGSAFTAPRHVNRRTWVYRVRPSAAHGPLRHDATVGRGWSTAPLAVGEGVHDANRLRWDPPPLPSDDDAVDFIDGMRTVAVNGDASCHAGMAAHTYTANVSMPRVLSDHDGELCVVPQSGVLRVATELGVLVVSPGELCVVPRGMRFRVELPDGPARGYVCENYGAALRLPELGPIGANGLANARDFLVPAAAVDASTLDAPTTVITKHQGAFWCCDLPHSPLDVIAWHGSLVPVKFDLARFNAVGSVSYDHPDPSIFTVLTSPSEVPGTANVDVVVFPPRWSVADDTFRPPWFHRNVMSELMGLVRGVYDAKAEGFNPGGVSLHNSWTAHGPDAATYERATASELMPQRITDTLACMFETRWPLQVTRAAHDAPHRQRAYDTAWEGLVRRFPDGLLP